MRRAETLDRAAAGPQSVPDPALAVPASPALAGLQARPVQRQGRARTVAVDALFSFGKKSDGTGKSAATQAEERIRAAQQVGRAFHHEHRSPGSAAAVGDADRRRRSAEGSCTLA